MPKKSLYSPEETYQVISEVIDGRCNVNSITKKYSLSIGIIESWVHKYNENAFEGVKEAKPWNKLWIV
ncbi:helix-turn-helix domain-containing protein [Enterococcus mundtii]|uniref:helix-turn-helix domain-containing protein n=1 Tax=Enterococcus mundtii TaxID=53346 RepID=UPI00230451E8|nr:helix-turn-helix domain-containing protein [Enterococcus mundtii]